MARLDVHELLRELDKVDRRIVELRYLQNYTLQETGKILLEEGLIQTTITKERVRQREVRAMNRIRSKIGPENF